MKAGHIKGQAGIQVTMQYGEDDNFVEFTVFSKRELSERLEKTKIELPEFNEGGKLGKKASTKKIRERELRRLRGV